MSTVLGSTNVGNPDGSGVANAGQQSGSGNGGQANGGSGANGNANTNSVSNASWRDGLPDDLKTNATLSNIADVSSLAKSYVHAQSLIGKKGVIVPNDKSSDDDWKSFYKQLGQPELDKYELAPEKDVKVDETIFSKFKEVAHSSGLLPKQAKGILDWYTKLETEMKSAGEVGMKAQQAKDFDGLKSEWGQAYDKNVRLAQLAVKEVGGDTFSQYLDKTGLGNNVELIKVLSKVGSMLGEDKIRGEGANGFSGQTPKEIRLEIAKLMDNPAYYDGSHKSHKLVVDQVADLYKKLSS